MRCGDVAFVISRLVDVDTQRSREDAHEALDLIENRSGRRFNTCSANAWKERSIVH
jgi:hypothetical protein